MLAFAWTIRRRREPNVCEIEQLVRFFPVEDGDKLSVFLAVIRSNTDIRPVFRWRSAVKTVQYILQLVQIDFLEPDKRFRNMTSVEELRNNRQWPTATRLSTSEYQMGYDKISSFRPFDCRFEVA